MSTLWGSHCKVKAEEHIWSSIGILVWNVFNDTSKCFTGRFSMALPPDKLVQVAWQHLSVAAFHVFYFGLVSIPVRLHAFSVSPCCTVYKLYDWFTVWCNETVGRGCTLLYAARWSLCMIVPGAVRAWIIGSNIAASCCYTISIYILLLVWMRCPSNQILALHLLCHNSTIVRHRRRRMVKWQNSA